MNEPKNKYVAFIDLLGFTKQLVNPMSGEADRMKIVIDYYRELMEQALRTIGAHVGVSKIVAEISKGTMSEISFRAISDSIIIATDNLYDIMAMVAGVQKFVLYKGMAIRGGIAKGLHWEEAGEGNLLMVSPAFVAAYYLESKVAKTARVIICKGALSDIQFSNSVYVRGEMGMFVQCEDDYFAINSMTQLGDKIGTTAEQDFTVEHILQGMRYCDADKEKSKWAWLADLYNFEALRLHGGMDDEEWRQYFTTADSIGALLKKRLHEDCFCNYENLAVSTPNRFIDIQDLVLKAKAKNINLSSLVNNSFEANVQIMIGK